MTETTKLIKEWMYSKELDKTLEPNAQLVKVMEELGEVASAILRGNEDGIRDGIGDVYVTIVLLAELCGMSIEECATQAWSEISDRKGVVVDGTFIKTQDMESFSSDSKIYYMINNEIVLTEDII